MSVIPDPIDPLAGAIDGDGGFLGAIFVAPVGTPWDEMRKPENHIGYSAGFELGDEDDDS